MRLAAAEHLIAALVAQPNGLGIAAATAVCARDLDPILQQLEQRGYRVTRVAGALHLDDAAAHFDPEAFERMRTGTWGSPFEVWESTPSTNDLARAGAEAGAPHGACWLAESQTHGRGRQGRSWICAPRAGLLVSGVLRLALHASPQPLWLPLALGLGACEALRLLGIPARTKWPNDILIGDAKLGGLLVETRFATTAASATTTAATIFGLGLNVRPGAIAPSDDVHAATLDAMLDDIAREELLARLLVAMESRVADWSAGRFEELRAAWLHLDCVPGRMLRVVTPEGELVARACSVTDAGLLDLELEDGTRRQVAAGEVHLA